jgi:ribosomal protein S1
VNSCSEVVQVGQEVDARVLGTDRENRRISLSIKAVHAHAASEESAHAATVTGPAKPRKERKKPLRGGLSSHFDW